MKFIKHISLYTFVGLFGGAINFFVMPVLSHYLSPTDYGLLALFNSYVTILIPLTGLLANSIISIEFFKEKDRSVFADKFTSVQVVPFVVALIGCLFVWQFYSASAQFLELEKTSRIWGFIIVFITLSTIYVEQLFTLLIIEKKAGLYAALMMSRVAIEVTITIYFVVYRGMNWQGRMYSWAITSLLYATTGFIYFYRNGYLRGRIKLPFIKQSVLFGLPLILHTVGKFVVNQSDRLFIAKMVSLDEAGIYTIGYTMGMLILIIINAFFNFYAPFVLERLTNLTDEKKLQIVRLNYLYIVAIIAILILITVVTPFFFDYFINDRYNKGVKYVFWVGLGYFFWGGYMLFVVYINYFNKNSILGWLAVVNVLTNLLFNYLFIKWVGAIGAAYATALSFFLIFVIIAYHSNKLVRLPWLNFNLIFKGGLRKSISDIS